MTRILCVAGEVSGDRILAPIVQALSAAGAESIGVGGDRSIGAGLEPVAHINDFCVGGVAEIVSAVPRGLSLLRRLRALARTVDRILLINWPEMNMRLLSAVMDPGHRVAFIAPPQAWAWRPWRAERLKSAGFLGCLFKFEADWYRERGCQATWVGAPFSELVATPLPERPGIALLPGSRGAYVRRLLPIQLDAVERLLRDRPELSVHLGRSPNMEASWIDQLVRDRQFKVSIWPGAEEALSRSSLALAGLGTVTLEAALAGRPFVGMGRVHPASGLVGRMLIKTEQFSLPNLVLGGPVFPEFVQGQCTPENTASAAKALLDSPGYHLAALAELKRRVDGGTGDGPVLDFLLR